MRVADLGAVALSLQLTAQVTYGVQGDSNGEDQKQAPRTNPPLPSRRPEPEIQSFVITESQDASHTESEPGQPSKHRNLEVEHFWIELWREEE